MIERIARLFKLPLIFIKLPKLFVICRRRIIQNLRLHFLDARPSSKRLKHAPQQPQVRQHFRDDIHTRSQEPAEENNVEPIVLWPSPHEVHDRQSLHDEAPRIEEVAQPKHGRPPCQQNRSPLQAGQTETPLSTWRSYCLFGRFPACYDQPAWIPSKHSASPWAPDFPPG